MPPKNIIDPSKPTGPKVIDLSWDFLPKAEEIINHKASQKLAVGGTGSGKTSNMVMHAIIDYVLRYPKCDVLFLRRTFADLEKGLIKDFKEYVPEDLYKYNESKHIATMRNGSKIFFGHLANGSEKDLEQYQGGSFVVILIDECGQFSLTAWNYLRSRNRVNPGCQPDPVTGRMPRPVMIGCTNPIGPYWTEYKRVFVEKKPVEDIEGMRVDKNGRFWVEENGIETSFRCIHNPDDFAYVHSTLLDNPYMLAKDPGLFDRLNSQPEEMRQIWLFGAMDGISGAYFSNFSKDRNTLNLRKYPDMLVWQPWQPKWLGMDFGRAHHCSVYWFTKAMLKRMDGSSKLVTVCYREFVTKGKNNVELADEIAKMSTSYDENSNKVVEEIKAIYFSHEKFNKQMEAHSPASEFSNLLRARGLCAVTPATRDRVGRASLTYNLLDRGELIILDSCPDIISALPSLTRNPKNPEDVLKIDNKADDCYDGFSYGIFGYLNTKPKPQHVKDQERIASMSHNPFGQRLAIYKQQGEAKRQEELASMPSWQRRLHDQGLL